jgi:hypothetical protein
MTSRDDLIREQLEKLADLLARQQEFGFER